MEKRRRFTRNKRKDIIDALIAEATNRLFQGDKRDGASPAITLDNFLSEMPRYGAIAFRARLIRLSDTELLAELNAAAEHERISAERRREYHKLAEQNELEDADRARRKRQAELGRRHNLQSGILAAACHYRKRGLTAKNAWHEIKRQPYSPGDGISIVINDGEMQQLDQAGKCNRQGIKFGQWQKRYWIDAR